MTERALLGAQFRGGIVADLGAKLRCSRAIWRLRKGLATQPEILLQHPTIGHSIIRCCKQREIVPYSTASQLRPSIPRGATAQAPQTFQDSATNEASPAVVAL
ncbi:hypothetical protein VNI00_009205 [Paramarasmius palmivorus]|uniref:Uncharacterized protein n=1 Tax=Paramarasmius palmivorus TaxID=297713 RepID=A0AAW0CR77_9AGAR